MKPEIGFYDNTDVKLWEMNRNCERAPDMAGQASRSQMNKIYKKRDYSTPKAAKGGKQYPNTDKTRFSQRRSTAYCDMVRENTRYCNMSQHGTQGTNWMKYLSSAEMSRDNSQDRTFEVKMKELDHWDPSTVNEQPSAMVPFVKLDNIKEHVGLLRKTTRDLQNHIIEVIDEKLDEKKWDKLFD